MERIPSYESDFDNLKATELRLGLPGVDLSEKPAHIAPRGSKRLLVEDVEECPSNEASSELGSVGSVRDAAPLSKTQVVGWPPVRSYWRNISFKAKKEAEVEIETETTRIYVKVSMDGAPYLRKIDLNLYQGYKELREALENMFQCFSLGDGSEYAITYEDKDGDWMLVGDVPWEMFISSCKRLRIMRGAEARGLGSN